MNKYFLGIIGSIIVIPISITLTTTKSIAQSCANYWVNPQTGKQECLKVTRKPSFQYLGKTTRIDKSKKKVTVKFYVEKNIPVSNGISKPLKQVTTFSNGYRFDDEIVIDCNNYAIAYKSEAVTFKGKLKAKDEYDNLEFEPIKQGEDSANQRTHNYICNGVIPKS